jgi:hypothetical protein
VTRSLSIFTHRRAAVFVALSALLFSASCGDKVLQGKGSSYLIVSVLTASSGAKPATFGTVLESDVVTIVKQQQGSTTVLVPTIFEDLGQVSLRMAMKDPGTGVSPSDTNSITIERYHVDYTRSDGRNTQGVDVPYAFDGAVTGTVSTTGTTLSFAIVRAQAKLEAPLMAMRGLGGAMILSTLAQVTFYGHDQAGNAVSVVGTISINFADWGDPS